MMIKELQLTVLIPSFYKDASYLISKQFSLKRGAVSLEFFQFQELKYGESPEIVSDFLNHSSLLVC